MRINIHNVEELVFYDKEVWRGMPELIHLRDQWRVSRMAPALRAMGRKAIIDFLKSAKGRHEKVLSDRFGKSVTIDRLESSLVKNIEFSALEELPELGLDEAYNGFATFRDGDKVFVTFWR